ncbi:hypothetical protein K458DRAFT_427352 [Lentithecium fluviatile CBS 122367]|uniref:DUF7514 domain-containing protein n=1 Tax=Lentithecium fluviatile CBS 122367 TaxID=1168545 RepID=A0A6G1JEX2_9PLEO|nr:hypothetical protein K458DRAFT_427352 [Lentithecium fluviatile CBS 122367]
MDYRNQPDHQQTSYPSSYDHNYDPRPYNQESQFCESRRPVSRSSSLAHSDSHPPPIQQPLKNALNNAFDKSDSARAVDPDLIAQITAEVKKSVLDEIKMSGMAGVTGTGQPAAPQPYAVQPPLPTTSLPPRNVYTPPSPKHVDLSSNVSASPDVLTRDPLFDGADDTPTPRHLRSPPVDTSHERTRSRPPPAARMPTEETYTPIEKMWQRLFDQQGQPTARLGQFLRGLAVHLIEDYEPKKSLVISPAKMQKFYNDVRLNQEIYPWNTIFGKLSYSTLSKIYREMRCQHHLIQEHSADQPQIPALTPDGFQEWMTIMIQAYPDAEYERLSRAVLDMPISNADDCKERFPKELPRRLFPNQEHLHAQQRCAAVLSAEGVGPLRRAPTFPPPPPINPSTTAHQGLERERNPYVGQSDTRAVESEDEHEPLSIPIERERKPYSAAPGGGKFYEDEHSRSVPPEVSMHEQRRRTQSTASQSQWIPPAGAPHQQANPRTGSQANGRRPRSPSFSSYGTRSDPANVQNIPGSYYTSNVYDSEEENRRFAKDAEIRRNEWAGRHESDAGHHRRSTTSTDSSFGSQPRSVYEDEYYRGRGGNNGYENRDHESRRY